MSFADELKSAFDDGIRPAIEEDCKLTAHHLGRIQHNDQITDRILAGIRSCQFMVADVTAQRQGVYFEAGFAMGLGRIVIWSCHRDDFPNIHFDTRQFNHIKWTTATDLREQLAARIQATVQIPASFGQ